MMLKMILNTVHCQSPPGRFLDHNVNLDTWTEVDEETVLVKIANYLIANKVKRAENKRNSRMGSKIKKITDSLQSNKFVSQEDMLYHQQFLNKRNTYVRDHSKKNRERYELLKGEDCLTLGLTDRLFIEKYKSVMVGGRRICRRRKAIVNQLKHFGSQICNVNSGNTTMLMLGMTQPAWSLLLVQKFNNDYATTHVTIAVLFFHHPDAEVDEIIPVYAWNFTIVWHELSCWHFLNSQLLLRKDNNEKRAYYDKEDVEMMIADVQHWYSKHQSEGKAIVDAMHKTSV